MGSGDWFKTIINRKKVKLDKSKKSKGTSASENSGEIKNKSQPQKNKANGRVKSKSNRALPNISEDVAATRIQTAFRGHMARKTLRCMRGTVKFQKLTQTQTVRKQAMNTLSHLHSWSRIQAEVRDRRLCMVIEGRLKQRKLENQLKLEAKLHDLEVDWNSGAETMEEILARIHQREEAAVKRERALAYAFSHQWRANSNQSQSPNASELGKANWGWSWKERWIAARPWESRLQSQSISPKKAQNKSGNKAGKNSNLLTAQKSVPAKTAILNGKLSGKPRRLSYPGAEKPAKKKSDKNLKEATIKKRDINLNEAMTKKQELEVTS